MENSTTVPATVTADHSLPKASQAVVTPQPTRRQVHGPETTPPQQNGSAPATMPVSEQEIKARILELDHEIHTLKNHRNKLADEGETSFMRLKQLNATLGEAKASAIISGDQTEEHKIAKEYDDLFDRNRNRQNDLRQLAVSIETRQKERSTAAQKYRHSYRGRAVSLAKEELPVIESDIIDAAARYTAMLKAKLGIQADVKHVTAKLFTTKEFKQRLEHHTKQIDEMIGGTPL